MGALQLNGISPKTELTTNITYEQSFEKDRGLSITNINICGNAKQLDIFTFYKKVWSFAEYIIVDRIETSKKS